MTIRQKVLKTLYPAILFFGKITGANAHTNFNTNNMQPKESFYNLQDTLNNGNPFAFENLKGKKVMLVNTASNCGYTNQYEALQTLHTKYSDNLVVIGFPSNDFKEQEKGNDEEIASFCKVNFGVSFSLMKKSGVVKNAQQNRVFEWLSDSTKNGWNDQAPVWNFSKYLINENGVLVNVFEPGISPLSEEVIKAIEQR